MILWTIPYGMQVVMCFFVGLEVGKGILAKARYMCWLLIKISLAVSLLILVILFSCWQYLVIPFTQDQELINMSNKAIFIIIVI